MLVISFRGIIAKEKATYYNQSRKKCKQFKKEGFIKQEDPICKQDMHSITSVAPEAVVVVKKEPAHEDYIPTFFLTKSCSSSSPDFEQHPSSLTEVTS